MTAKPRRLMPPAAGRTQVEKIELESFARRLHAAMVAKGWSNSDLARAVWGETTDSNGYKVARNRDRVAVYLKGAGFPEPQTLHKIAEVLGMSKEELAPDLTAAAIDRERPEFAITMVAGHADKCHIQINALLPIGVAMQIGALFEQGKRDQNKS